MDSDGAAPLHRRDLLRSTAVALAALMLRVPLAACSRGDAAPSFTSEDPDRERLTRWSGTLQAERLIPPKAPLGRAATRVGELAAGTPYRAQTLESYIRDGGNPAGTEPLTLSLTHFDCVTLVEACLAVARLTGTGGRASWEAFGREVERMRYRGGKRGGYASRLHYFSEWIADGARRGLVRDLGPELGSRPDARPLRFMSEHRGSYAALANQGAFDAVAAHERRLDASPRNLVARARIPEIQDRLQTGDVLAFATPIAGLDVTHTGLAYRSADGVMRVLHAPLSGGVVQVSPGTVADYVNGLRNATGILAARPLRG
jgi:hypothetical protein